MSLVLTGSSRPSPPGHQRQLWGSQIQAQAVAVSTLGRAMRLVDPCENRVALSSVRHRYCKFQSILVALRSSIGVTVDTNQNETTV